MKLNQLLYTMNFLSIIVVSQMILAFLPNVQITTVLFLVYFNQNKFKDSLTLIISYTIIMGLIWGINLFLIPMGFSWFFFLILYWIKKDDNIYYLAVKGIIMGNILGFTYGIFNLILYNWRLNTFFAYIVADIPFQIIMSITNFITILVLFERIVNLNTFLKKGE